VVLVMIGTIWSIPVFPKMCVKMFASSAANQMYPRVALKIKSPEAEPFQSNTEDNSLCCTRNLPIAPFVFVNFVRFKKRVIPYPQDVTSNASAHNSDYNGTIVVITMMIGGRLSETRPAGGDVYSHGRRASLTRGYRTPRGPQTLIHGVVTTEPPMTSWEMFPFLSPSPDDTIRGSAAGKNTAHGTRYTSRFGGTTLQYASDSACTAARLLAHCPGSGVQQYTTCPPPPPPYINLVLCWRVVTPTTTTTTHHPPPPTSTPIQNQCAYLISSAVS